MCGRLGTGRRVVGSVIARSLRLRDETGLYDMASITGTVKFFNTTKGFGFISPENGEKDAFVHISAVQRSGLQGLYEGDKVTYELETGRDGKVSATNLTLLS
jgi:cold shock protein